jgi:hypothetical protein
MGCPRVQKHPEVEDLGRRCVCYVGGTLDQSRLVGVTAAKTVIQQSEARHAVMSKRILLSRLASGELCRRRFGIFIHIA